MSKIVYNLKTEFKTKMYYLCPVCKEPALLQVAKKQL